MVDSLFKGILPWFGFNARYFSRMIQVYILFIMWN